MPDPTAQPEKKPDKLERLKAKEAAIKAEIARHNAARNVERRRLDTRKKILAGAIVLEEAARDPQFAAWLQKQLARGLKQPRDRAVFDLPPLPVTAANDDAGKSDAKETQTDGDTRPA